MFLTVPNLQTIKLDEASFSLTIYGGFSYGVVKPKRPIFLRAGQKCYLTVPSGNFVCFVNRTLEDGRIELVGGVEILKGYVTYRQYVSLAWNGWEKVDFDSETYVQPDEKVFTDSSGRESRWAVIYRTTATTIASKKARIGWNIKLPERNIYFSVKTIRVNPGGDYWHEIGFIKSTDGLYYKVAESNAQTDWNGVEFKQEFSPIPSPASAAEIRILNSRTSFAANTAYYGGFRVRQINFYVYDSTQKKVLEYEKNRLQIPFNLRDTSGNLDDTVEYRSEEPFYDFAQACEVYARLLDKQFIFTDGEIVFSSLQTLTPVKIQEYEESFTSTFTHVSDFDQRVENKVQAQGTLLQRANSVLQRTMYSGLTKTLDFNKVSSEGDNLTTSTVNSFIKRAWVQENIQTLQLSEVKKGFSVVSPAKLKFPIALDIFGETVIPIVVEYNYPSEEVICDLSNYLTLKRR